MKLARPFAAVPLAAALVAFAVAEASAPAPARATTPLRAQLAQFSCVHALNPQDRAVAVEAVMRPLAQTRKLAVKFDLLERGPDAIAPTVVQAGDLGVWKAPPIPTLGQLPGDVWHLNKSVLDLDAPDVYQFRVSFRWTGAHNKVLGTAIRYSRTCREKELRPDLAMSSITVAPITGHPDEELYTATIANQGVTAAGPFEVLFVPGDGSAPTTKTVALLDGGQTHQLQFTGPLCDSTSPPSITADATQETDDYDRANNAMTATCPAATASPSAVAGGARR